MKLKVYHVYFLVIFLGSLVSVILDFLIVGGLSGYGSNLSYALGYGSGVTTFYGGILLLFYYLVVYIHKRRTK